MPPGRHSSSSHSSRSHSSSSSRSSSSRSSSSRSSSSRSSSSRSRSHSSSSHSSRSYGSRTYSSSYSSKPRIKSVYIDKRMPKEIKNNSLLLDGKKHNYIYYDREWIHPKTNEVFHKGYYNEEGTYYDANDIVFKNQDGTFKSHFRCEYCGAEAEYVWNEGQYPTCNSCGATMSKTPVFIDELVNVTETSKRAGNKAAMRGIIILILFFMTAPGLFISLGILGSITSYNNHKSGNTSTSVEDEPVSNLDIYGSDIYLKKVDGAENGKKSKNKDSNSSNKKNSGNNKSDKKNSDKNSGNKNSGNKNSSKKKSDNKNSGLIYEICESTDDYEKCLSWDYGADSYYDYDTNCYIWYNTDVAPNLWQYWYDDIAGDSEYGWMECEGDKWYIETEDGWVEYEGDTSNLWHIKNKFDSENATEE
ncbi:MAG: hypothetical protein K6G11_04965 [Lachnospiraceae bacterium]|nr:hypothetical protein [Lachnospiraceae bacterium]